MRHRVSGNIVRRVEALEKQALDLIRLVPHSPEWLAHWDRRVYDHAISVGSTVSPL